MWGVERSIYYEQKEKTNYIKYYCNYFSTFYDSPNVRIYDIVNRNSGYLGTSIRLTYIVLLV